MLFRLFPTAFCVTTLFLVLIQSSVISAIDCNQFHDDEDGCKEHEDDCIWDGPLRAHTHNGHTKPFYLCHNIIKK
ncbi:predicted protein [Lichtheimia corymbifera JMRC:FSU:9682]|uniref:Uncharacterized protein n=1 Tax=Lichtheimia corymbifera JMRC:FSU:9682 TaxID=1263082 RepID=A0A068SAJ2_9FUNG|nr:predicted protein [Lichtheimia corymbifera JMRC:FSU:9682]